MKRSLFIVAALILTAFGLQAENISADMAKKMAMDFFKSNASTLSVSRLNMVYDGSGNMARTSSQAPALYVFDNPDGKGFVIVSGDDIAYPILGYSFEFDFPKENIPPHVAWWLEGMEDRIEYGRKTGWEPAITPKRAADNIGSVVKKLETALWNQGEPFNRKTPIHGNGHSVTGCTITATAIVMFYHKYPEKGTGTIPAYTTDSYNLTVPARTLGHKYEWNKMLDKYAYGSYTDVQANAVATLMADLGHMLEADYSYSGTGASTGIIPHRLSTYLYYHKGALDMRRGDYVNEEWYNMLQNEIDNNRPVIYSGFNDESGHAFVLDGYTTEDYFSVNWGWGGSYNGYFLLDALSPAGSGIGGNYDHYNFNQKAVVGLKPEVGGEYVQKLSLGEKGMSIHPDYPFTDRQVTFITDEVASSGSVPFTGLMRWCLEDKDGVLKQNIQTFKVTELEPGWRYSELRVSLNASEPIKKGDRVRMYYKQESESEWVLMKGGEKCVWDLVLIEDIPLDESTQLCYNRVDKILKITTVAGVDVGFYSPGSVDLSSMCQSDGLVTTINTSDLSAGTYKLVLTDGTESVSVNIKLN
ncbi:MAG: C10 family peptidase [Bacteroidales bacterium]|nr:C10 family peptidase [Bacteroidales bacterium]